jgi:hypothetical protein
MELGSWFDAVPRHALDQMHFVSHVAAFRQSDHQEQATRVDDWNGLNWVIGLRVLGWLNWTIGLGWIGVALALFACSLGFRPVWVRFRLKCSRSLHPSMLFFASSNVSDQARVAYRKLLNGVTAWQFDFSLVVIFDLLAFFGQHLILPST